MEILIVLILLAILIVLFEVSYNVKVLNSNLIQLVQFLEKVINARKENNYEK